VARVKIALQIDMVPMHVNHLTAVKVQTIIWVINATTTVYAAMLPVYARVS
jgi:hypothetical protein